MYWVGIINGIMVRSSSTKRLRSPVDGMPWIQCWPLFYPFYQTIVQGLPSDSGNFTCAVVSLDPLYSQFSVRRAGATPLPMGTETQLTRLFSP